MAATPRITVLIPVYNRERYIAAAVDSVLAQSFTDFELLIVDDGSTDRSMEIVSSYTDSRIRIERSPSNKGGPWARNRGLDLARGEYVAMLDSDDTAAPERLARQVTFLDAHPSYALVGTGKQTMDASGARIKGFKPRPVTAAAIKAQLFFRCCIAQTSIMARTAIMRRYRYDERFVVSQDFELFARLSHAYPLANLPEALVSFRCHDAHVSSDRERVTSYQLIILKQQIETLGITPTADDVQRHFMLSRSRSWFVPDALYLEWAQDWLCRLREANRRQRRFEPQIFDRILGHLWISQCTKARLHITDIAQKTLARQGLRACVWSAACGRLWQAVPVLPGARRARLAD